MMKLKKMTLNMNGADRTFICDPEKDTLASVIRRLGLTGTKVGCGTGVCGACSVILNGKVILFLHKEDQNSGRIQSADNDRRNRHAQPAPSPSGSLG